MNRIIPEIGLNWMNFGEKTEQFGLSTFLLGGGGNNDHSVQYFVKIMFVVAYL